MLRAQPAQKAQVPKKGSRSNDCGDGILRSMGPIPASKKKEVPKKRKFAVQKEEKKCQRQNAKKARAEPSRFPGQTFLEKVAVSQSVALDYQKRIQGFFQFLKSIKISMKSLERNIQKLDEACCIFMNHMFDQGYELAEGTKFLAAVCDMYPGCGPKHVLFRTRRSLQGWLKTEPQRTRPPLPWALVAALALHMMRCGVIKAAAAILLCFTAYLRPGEALDMQVQDLVRPMPTQNFWSILLHPAERQQRSKVGLADKSILLDGQQVPWLGPALQHLTTSTTFLIDMTYHELVQCWQQALLALGLPKDHAVLYQLRHSGPSHDRFFLLRSLAEVKQRGRWMSDSTMRRYEAHARLNQEFNELPKKTQAMCLKAEAQIAVEGPKFFGLRRRVA